MATKLENALKGQLSDQLAEVYRVTSNGTRDYGSVRKALQNIIEGKFTDEPRGVLIATARQSYQRIMPDWYVSPEQQLERVKQLNVECEWGFSDSDIPSIPEDFTPRTSTEVLMLSVYLPKQDKVSGLQRTFDELWDLIQAPEGYSKHRWYMLKSDSKHLRSAPGYSHRPGVRWVIFDPSAYHGKSPLQALKLAKSNNIQLAGVEVFMAALLFPTWPASWSGDLSPFPNLSGLQFYWNTDWLGAPYLNAKNNYRQLGLSAYGAVYGGSLWASPSVRECKN